MQKCIGNGILKDAHFTRYADFCIAVISIILTNQVTLVKKKSQNASAPLTNTSKVLISTHEMKLPRTIVACHSPLLSSLIFCHLRRLLFTFWLRHKMPQIIYKKKKHHSCDHYQMHSKHRLCLFFSCLKT